MLQLHWAGPDGHCEHCGQTWPCSEGLVMVERVRDQVDDSTPTEFEQDCICTSVTRAHGKAPS